MMLLAISQYCKDGVDVPAYHRIMKIKPLRKTRSLTSAELDNANLKNNSYVSKVLPFVLFGSQCLLYILVYTSECVGLA